MAQSIFQIAREHSYYNHKEVMESQYAGCYHCKRAFPIMLIDEEKHCITTTPHGTQEPTVFCPFCEVDNVIGDASGYEVTSNDFLNYMYNQNNKK